MKATWRGLPNLSVSREVRHTSSAYRLMLYGLERANYILLLASGSIGYDKIVK